MGRREHDRLFAYFRRNLPEGADPKVSTCKLCTSYDGSSCPVQKRCATDNGGLFRVRAKSGVGHMLRAIDEVMRAKQMYDKKKD